VGRIGDIYAAMDVCVFASRSEGFGLAIAEAWYCRVPVVATRVGIVAEHPDLAVLLPDDPTADDLAGAVFQALSTVSQTKRIDLARQVIFEKYSASAMVNQWKSYLESKLR
jgi:glycosyltransferase involved in cell wall biosynthesis